MAIKLEYISNHRSNEVTRSFSSIYSAFMCFVFFAIELILLPMYLMPLRFRFFLLLTFMEFPFWIGKSVRRRAASMETSKYEKRRGRVKKQVENLKNGGLASKFEYKKTHCIPFFNAILPIRHSFSLCVFSFFFFSDSGLSGMNEASSPSR